jgi:hypothetical protein
MVDHECGISARMAVYARLDDGNFVSPRSLVGGMARATGETRPVVVTLVIDQRKTKLIMRDLGDGNARQAGIPALVIGMAQRAIL